MQSTTSGKVENSRVKYSCMWIIFYMMGSDLFHRKVIDSFMRMFTVGSKEDTDFVYVGWHMKQSRHGITVSQDNYIKKVDNPDMEQSSAMTR